MTRLWPQGQPITVNGDAAGRPRQFSWQGREHTVTAITRQWRVDSDWWRTRVWRTYFKLSTDTGLLVILYHDQVQDAWYLQRLYD